MTVPRGRRYRNARTHVLASADRCTWCGKWISDELPIGHPNKATADHLTTVADGGLDVVDNLVPACHPCNSKRGRREPEILRVDLEGAEDW